MNTEYYCPDCGVFFFSDTNIHQCKTKSCMYDDTDCDYCYGVQDAPTYSSIFEPILKKLESILTPTSKIDDILMQRPIWLCNWISYQLRKNIKDLNYEGFTILNPFWASENNIIVLNLILTYKDGLELFCIIQYWIEDTKIVIIPYKTLIEVEDEDLVRLQQEVFNVFYYSNTLDTSKISMKLNDICKEYDSECRISIFNRQNMVTVKIIRDMMLEMLITYLDPKNRVISRRIDGNTVFHKELDEFLI